MRSKIFSLSITFFFFTNCILFSQSTWSSQTSGTSNNLWDVHFVDSNTGWIVGNSGKILKTTDGGSNWSSQTSGTTRMLSGVYFTDSNTGTAIGDGGTILRTTDGGTTWTSQDGGTTRDFYGVFFTDASTGIIVGASGTTLKTTDGGSNWTRNDITTGDLRAIFFVDSNTGYAVGEIGKILKTTDGGSNWSSQSSGTTTRLNGVYFVDSNTGWAVGVGGGTILKTADGGSNWSSQSGASDDLWDVHFIDSNNGWASGLSGGIIKTTNGGSNWSSESSGTNTHINGLHMYDANTGWVVGNSGLILKYSDSTAPAAPTGLTATAGNQKVTLSWTANTESDLSKYRVYRSTTTGFTPSSSNQIAEPTANTYSDQNLTNDTTYYYKISAVDNAGNESGYSSEVTATPTLFRDISAGLVGVFDGAAAWGDYDNDGDLDILLTGSGVSKVYRNDGGSFTDISAGLAGLENARAAWGDYDNDGDLDILLTGSDISKVYRNDGESFEDISAPLAGRSGGFVSWVDYDNDGDLDIFIIGGFSGQGPVSQFYRNDRGSFSGIPDNLPGLAFPSAAWGDYDNDGDLDLLLMGAPGQDDISRIYKNTDGTFTDISAGLSGVRSGSAAFGDYDGDGDLDILLTGSGISKLYKNTDGTFSEISTSMAGVSQGSVAWGDYENDGDLDILITGLTQGPLGVVSRIYPNDEGNFTHISAELVGVELSSVAWGDYDNDGDLDVLLAGTSTGFPSGAFTKVFRNDVSTANTAPTAPSSLVSTVAGTSFTLSWDKATDEQTAQNGLTYNLRVGTTPGGYEVMSPMADSLGFRRIPALGNVNHNTSWTLKNLTDGTYYWSVQAVDNAFSGSAFATEQSFTIDAPPLPPKSLIATPGDGQVTLKWRKITETDFAKYLIYGDTSPNPTSKIDSTTSINDTTKTLTGLTNNTTYYYHITAVDTGGNESDYSNEVSVTPHKTLVPPTSLIATSGNQRVTLRWRKHPESDVAKYRIYGGTSSNPTSKIDSTTGINDTTKTLTGLTNGTTYYYRVTAVDSAGNESGYSSEVTATPALFRDISAGLVGVFDGAAAWGDYDNDGDLDILLTGSGVSKVYRNDGGSFTDISAGLAGLENARAAWGDYDNDGDLDILLTGSDISKVYRNDGESFEDISAPLAGRSGGFVSWVDYDNDGDLDIFIIGGFSGQGPVSQFYRNDRGSFSGIPDNLPGLAFPSAAWGDYDNDGDLDLLLMGAPGQDDISRIYKNTDGTFTDISAGLSGVRSGSAAFGDYDGDGDLDILLTGSGISKLYKNTDGTFSEISTSMAGVSQGSVAWGDYENDGDLDILITGLTQGPLGVVSRIYPNDEGNFTHISAELVGVELSSVAWGDYDNDGDLDVLLAGTSTGFPSGAFTKVFRNDVSTANTAPTAPSSLVSTVAGTSFTLSWDKATDEQTAQNGLTYNLRVGTTPGGYEVMSPMADSLGFRRIPALGNVNHNTSWTLKNLTDGTYYWSVQAVDNAFSGSAFATEQSFTIDAPPVPPTSLIATPGNQRVTLRWKMNPESDVAKYRIYGGTFSNPTSKVDSTAGINDTTKTLIGLTNGTTYYYRITAVDTKGKESDYSNEVSVTPHETQLTVKIDGTGDYSSIQAGINAAVDGDTILVHPGTYVENVNFDGRRIFLGSLFIVTGDTSYVSRTVIDGNQSGSVVTFAGGEDRTAFLEGFTLTNGTGNGGTLEGAISCNNASPTIVRNIVKDNAYYGIVCHNFSHPMILNNIVSNNGWDGIKIHNDSSPIVRNNIVVNNIAAGISFNDRGNPSIVNNVIYNNVAWGIQAGGNISSDNVSNNTIVNNGVGIVIGDIGPAELVIFNCIVWNNATSMDIRGQSRASISYSDIDGGPGGVITTGGGTLDWLEGNIDVDPLFEDSANRNYHLSNASPLFAAGIDSFEINGTWHVAAKTDLEGNPRPNPPGTYPDVGAYESSLGAAGPGLVPITDGIEGVDQDWTNSGTTLSAHWSAFPSTAGIASYQYAIGDIISDTSVVDWTELGASDTLVTVTGLNLENNKTYHFAVKGIDISGTSSPISRSNGITVDTEKPIVSEVIESHPSAQGDIDWIAPGEDVNHRWSGSDKGIIASYEYSVGTTSGNEDIVAWWNAGLDTFATSPSQNFSEGTKYFTNVRAKDMAGNLSGVASSDGFQVDDTPPTAGKVIDGATQDLDWTRISTSLTAAWSGFTDALSGIKQYEYAIGTISGGSDVVDWTSSGTDTSVTHDGLSLSSGSTYFSSVRARDLAGNLSDVSISDGITVDSESPFVGTVHDGLVGDEDWTNSSSTLSANWTGFGDGLSGIATFEYAIGTQPGGSQLVDWTGVGLDTSLTRSDLSLTDGTTYYVSVRAIDVVANVSETVSSDGITVDVSPPSVIEFKPDPATFLSLTEDSEILIRFSEPVVSYDLQLESALDFALQYDEMQAFDSLRITIESPLASLDTIGLSLQNVTDLSGLVADEMDYELTSELLADYTGDMKVDVSDLSVFIDGWTTKDYSLELGPVTGEVPHLVPHPDSTYDVRDGMSFVRMWYWSHQQAGSLMLARPLVGEQPEVSQSGHNVIISIPHEASVGQIVLQYAQASTDISVAGDELTEERMLLSQKEPGVGEILVEFGYLVDQDQKRIVLDTEFSTRDNSTVTMSYLLLGSGQEVITQGTKVIELRAIPERFALHQNYPNPFNPITNIRYDLPAHSRVSLVIYDILGRQVRTLVDDERIAGYHSVLWDGKDRTGAPVGTGVYIYRIHARDLNGGSYSKTHKMLLLK